MSLSSGSLTCQWINHKDSNTCDRTESKWIWKHCFSVTEFKKLWYAVINKSIIDNKIQLQISVCYIPIYNNGRRNRNLSSDDLLIEWNTAHMEQLSNTSHSSRIWFLVKPLDKYRKAAKGIMENSYSSEINWFIIDHCDQTYQLPSFGREEKQTLYTDSVYISVKWGWASWRTFVWVVVSTGLK